MGAMLTPVPATRRLPSASRDFADHGGKARPARVCNPHSVLILFLAPLEQG